jgi:Transcriptional Coactivator p15 (PC4)
MPSTKSGVKREAAIATRSEKKAKLEPLSEGWGFSMQNVKNEMHTSFTPNRDISKLKFGCNRFLVHSIFQDSPKIHIREYESKSGREYPTKKGICMSVSRLATLYSALPDIEEAVKLLRAGSHIQFKTHLGGGIYVSVNSDFKCVDIRRFFVPNEDSSETATRTGLAIRLGEFDNFLRRINELVAISADLVVDDKICANNFDHANEIVAAACRECNPFGYKLFNA